MTDLRRRRPAMLPPRLPDESARSSHHRSSRSPKDPSAPHQDRRRGRWTRRLPQPDDARRRLLRCRPDVQPDQGRARPPRRCRSSGCSASPSTSCSSAQSRTTPEPELIRNVIAHLSNKRGDWCPRLGPGPLPGWSRVASQCWNRRDQRRGHPRRVSDLHPIELERSWVGVPQPW
jgi:hypothetical protein